LFSSASSGFGAEVYSSNFINMSDVNIKSISGDGLRVRKADYFTLINANITGSDCAIRFYNNNEYSKLTNVAVEGVTYGMYFDYTRFGDFINVSSKGRLAMWMYRNSDKLNFYNCLIDGVDYDFSVSSSVSGSFNFTNVTFVNNDIVFADTSLGSINIFEYLDVNAGYSGSGLEDVSIFGRDKNSVVRDFGLTDADGNTRLVLLSKFVNRTDSIDYNNYSVSAVKLNYIAQNKEVNMSVSQKLDIDMVSNNMTINLISPENNWNVNGDIIFDASYNSFDNLSNISLYINGTMNQTKAVSDKVGLAKFNVSGLNAGAYNWSIRACNVGNFCKSSLNRSFTVDKVSPSIDIIKTKNGTRIASVGALEFNISSQDSSNNLSLMLDFNNSLVGWWRLDGDYKDYSGNGNDGPYTNYANEIQGIRGKAFEFDGKSEVPADVLYNDVFNITEAVTFSAWIKRRGVNSANDVHILSRPPSWYFYDAYNSGAVFGDLFIDGVRRGHVGTSVPFDEKWYLITFTYDSEIRKTKIYKNGNLVNSKELSGLSKYTIDESNGFIRIGRLANSKVKNLSLDDVMIFNRALSEAEIKVLYNANSNDYISNFSDLSEGESYNYTVYAYDQAGNYEVSNNMISVNNKPVVSDVVFNSTSGMNISQDNLTVYFDSSDLDLDNVSVITDFRKYNGTSYLSLAVLNMPFNANSSETTKDYSSYGNDGSVNGAKWISNGKVGGAYEFDGVDDKIDMGSVLNVKDKISIFAWINRTSMTGTIVNKGWDRYKLYLNSGSLRVGYRNDSGDFVYRGSIGISSNEWNYVGMIIDNSSNVSIFLNGEKVFTKEFEGNYFEGDVGRLTLGAGGDGTIHYFNGSIDEVQIYDYVLSEEQIKANYNAGLAGHSNDVVVSSETDLQDKFKVIVTPNDGLEDGASVESSVVELSNAPPVVNDVSVVSSVGKVDDIYTNESLIGYCNVSDDDNDQLNISYIWYKNDISVRSGYVEGQTQGNIEVDTFVYSNFVKHDNLTLECYASDNNYKSNKMNSSKIEIINFVPTNVTLLYPNNMDYMFVDRTPIFNWTNSLDIDNDNLTYRLEVAMDKDFITTLINLTSDLSNYQTIVDLDFTTYYWRVIVNDSESYSSYSNVFNFTVEPYVAVNLSSATTDFGNMDINQEDDTLDSNPESLVVDNIGNIKVNLSVNSSGLFSSVPLDRDNYQFMVGNYSGFDAYDKDNSLDSWTNFTSNLVKAVVGLDYKELKNMVRLHLRVRVPGSEPGGIKQSEIKVEAGIE
jgi:hypothetical protein